jgi:hypothetical protein
MALSTNNPTTLWKKLQEHFEEMKMLLCKKCLVMIQRGRVSLT